MRESFDDSTLVRRLGCWPWCTILLLLALPILFVGPSLLPGKRFLPILPSAFAPLSFEDPDAARAGLDGADFLAQERLFPQLTDEIAVREAWSHGCVPSWEPRLGLGQPLAATSSCGVWYPLNVIKLVLPPDIAAGWLALLALVLSGLGMHAFLGARGLSNAARVAGAWAFQAGGFAIVNLHDGAKVDAALWLPFALWSVESLLARRRFAGPMLGASIALSWLAGSPPIAVFVTTTMLLYAWVRSVASKRMRSAPLLATWTVLGVLAAAVQWMPLLEASSESLHARQDPAAIAAQSLPVATLATLWMPGLFGSASDNVVASRNPIAWWLTTKDEATAAQTADALKWNLFAGVAVLALAAAGIVAAPRKAVMPLVLWLLALGFALGAPFLRWTYALPGFDLGSPARASGVAWMLGPWLAALGLEALLAGKKRAWFGIAAVVVPATMFAAWLGALAADPHFAYSLQRTVAMRHDIPLPQVESVLPEALVTATGSRLVLGASVLAAVSISIVLVAFVTALVRRRSIVVATGLWLALFAFEGTWLAHEHLAPRGIGARALFPTSDAIDAIRDAAGDGRVVRIDRSPSGRADVEQLARPNMLAAYDIPDLTSCSAFTPRSLVELVGNLDPRCVVGTGIGRISDAKLLDKRAFDLLRVTCVLSKDPITSPRLTPVYSQPEFYVYRRSGALPIARVVPAELTLATDPAAALQIVVEEGVDVRRRAVAVGSDLPPEDARPRPAPGAFVAGDVEVTRPAANRLDVHLMHSSGGWLVLHEQWFPGWKARVNGAEAPVVRVDHVCRAVPVPPGDSIVTTQYSPDSLRAGLWTSFGALALAIGLVSFSSRRLPDRAISA